MTTNTKNLFESMTRRRVSCPQVTQQLWDTIKSIRNQRQVPTAERIQKIMLKDFLVNEQEVTRQLNHCVRDGLLDVTKRTVSKGNYAGSEQEWYKLPSLKIKNDEFDWYCFDCHRAGDVICCSKSSCQRVYHLACISSSELPQGAFICHVCRMCEPSPSKFQMKRSKLNRLMGYTLQRLKSKYPLTLKDQRLPPPNKNVLVSDRIAQALNPPMKNVGGEDEAWRTLLLIAREMNLTIVEEKIDRHRYRLLEEFHADCLNIVHNMVIYNGVDSAVADIARQMLRDCVEDLQEIRQCVDCYKMSHGDKKKLWFCKPCRKPHELVYAKQPGLPYWPAKVMKVDGDQYDVRFFGAQHLRALVPKSLIRSISVNIHTLQVKRSSGWNRACEELRKHQELLERARIETRNFTTFVESSSSSESESVDSETERRMERELRLAKLKAIIEKQTTTALKQKVKRRRSSSGMRPPEQRKRGRPRANTPAPSAAKSTTGRPGRKRREVYDSSDSLDSFHVPEPTAKKNTDEMFDELLRSDVSGTAVTNGAKKGVATGGEKAKKPAETQRAVRKPRGRPRTSGVDKKAEVSEESKIKSDTMDSSTISSFDDVASTRSKRIFPSSNNQNKYSSSDDSDSDDADSDLESSSSNHWKTPSRRPKAKDKNGDVPNLSQKEDKKNEDEDEDISDDSSTTETDSDLPKKAASGSGGTKKIEDSSSSSSDSDDDDSSKKKLPSRRCASVMSTKSVNEPKARIDSSDSENATYVKTTRSAKAKDTSESTDVETPPSKRQPARGVAKKVSPQQTSHRGRGRLAPERTPQRASERNLSKAAERKEEEKSGKKPTPKKQLNNDESSDSETPLSSKAEKKDRGKMGKVRDILKKYITNANEEDSRQNESSDTAKQESDSDSESGRKNESESPGKSKTESLEEKVQKIKKQKTTVDEKKGKFKKTEHKEEQKEETVVSSSSQEPSTRSVAVQTLPSHPCHPGPPSDLKHRADRISELEKELQMQAQTNRILEMEFDKTKVLVDRMRNDHDDEIGELKARHMLQISEIKKKQWCYNCEMEAIYHCCWNTAYCSVECQQAHWQSEHKRVCRRKR